MLAIIVAVLLVAGATVVSLATSARPDRDVDSGLPDGYDSEDSLGAEDYGLEDGPIEADSTEGVLAAVNQNDENKYTPEEWADILEKVEKGEILFFNTLEEEDAYFQETTSDSVIDASGPDIQLISTPEKNWETAIGSVELIVTLGDGSKLSKTYAEYFGYSTPYFLQADLLGNNSDVIILVIPIYGSTYDASDVHVLTIEDDKLIEILTILDTPITGNRDFGEYEQTLFVIPQPADNFGLEYDWYYYFCTGASLVTVDGKAALRIRHLMREVIPYSVLLWDGQEWAVSMQYADDID